MQVWAASDVTVIDVTGLAAGAAAEHTHVYASDFDSSYHWEYCTICGVIQNKKAHTLKNTWLTSGAHCAASNQCTTICTDGCGYSKIWREACTMPSNPTYFATIQGWNHHTTCAVCGYWYGGGACTKSNGTRITCTNRGTCAVCGYNYSTSSWGHFGYGSCTLCGAAMWNTGSTTVSQSWASNRKSLTLTCKYTCSKSFTLSSVGYYSDSGGWSLNGSPSYSKSGNTVTVTYSINITSTPFQKAMYIQPRIYGTMDGKDFETHCDNVYFYPDNEAPTITEISAEYPTGRDPDATSDSYGWAKNIKLTVKGTESYSDIVYVTMYNAAGTLVYNQAAVSVSSGSYLFTFTPNIETAGAQNYTVYVADRSGNRTSKTITIERVDSKTPTVNAESDYTTPWTTYKDAVFAATDDGIGLIKIGFNSMDDLEYADYESGEYSRKYRFIGDAYNNINATVYYQDGVGNVSSQSIKIGKIDNTAPTITAISPVTSDPDRETTLTIEANDKHSILGEGSGVVGYAITTTDEVPDKDSFQTSNKFKVTSGEYYIWAIDLVGNISQSYKAYVLLYEGNPGTGSTQVQNMPDPNPDIYTGTDAEHCFIVGGPPHRDGYDFMGWSTDQQEYYYPGDNIIMPKQ